MNEAIDFLERASAMSQENIDLLFKLGNLYYQLSNFDNAYRHFKAVISLKPLDPYAYYFAGRSADSLGETDLARQHYQKYLKLNNSSQEAQWIRNNIPELNAK